MGDRGDFLIDAKVGDRVKSRGGEEGEIVGIFPDHPYPIKVQFKKHWCSCRYDGIEKIPHSEDVYRSQSSAPEPMPVGWCSECCGDDRNEFVTDKGKVTELCRPCLKKHAKANGFGINFEDER